jgi:hypothetical protein
MRSSLPVLFLIVIFFFFFLFTLRKNVDSILFFLFVLLMNSGGGHLQLASSNRRMHSVARKMVLRPVYTAMHPLHLWRMRRKPQQFPTPRGLPKTLRNSLKTNEDHGVPPGYSILNLTYHRSIVYIAAMLVIQFSTDPVLVHDTTKRFTQALISVYAACRVLSL